MVNINAIIIETGERFIVLQAPFILSIFTPCFQPLHQSIYRSKLNRCFEAGKHLIDEESKIMEIKWFGTATLSFSIGDKSILFDPFLPLNSRLPSPSIEDLAALGDIFITHGHIDHRMHVPQVVQAGEAVVYCCKTASESLYREGVPENRVVIVKPGDKFENGPFEITVYKGAHICFDLPLI